MAGYSSTPLAQKLGVRQQSRVRIENAPANYSALLHPLPAGVKISPRLQSDIDIWHLFVKSKKRLSERLEKAMRGIRQNGMIWVSWPKQSSAVASDMSENEIRNAALPLGLVDVKVCAIDETWSGLKLVIRRSERK